MIAAIDSQSLYVGFAISSVSSVSAKSFNYLLSPCISRIWMNHKPYSTDAWTSYAVVIQRLQFHIIFSIIIAIFFNFERNLFEFSVGIHGADAAAMSSAVTMIIERIRPLGFCFIFWMSFIGKYLLTNTHYIVQFTSIKGSKSESFAQSDALMYSTWLPKVMMLEYGDVISLKFWWD